VSAPEVELTVVMSTIQMGRAANGHDGVGAGFDAEVIYRGYGRDALVAVYSVLSREWEAIGVLTIGSGADLDAIARDVASNPGAFEPDVAWRDRDPETYAQLAEEFDELEALYHSGDTTAEVQS
jgi:hypothetical protein